MTRKLITVSFISLAVSATLLTSGCSPTSYASQEGMMGALTGTLLGSGVGWYLGEEKGNMNENIALNAAIGGGLGLLSGGMMYDQNIKVVKKREIVVREAQLINKNQTEIDRLRENVYDSSSWGGNETKPWNERYEVGNSDQPFQGTTAYRPPSAH